MANVTAEVEARTIGASVYTPALEPGRHWEADPFMGIPQVAPPDAAPFTGGSMLVYYDGGPVTWINPGNPARAPATPPNENVPPRAEWGYGGDPHGYPRAARGRPGQRGWLLRGTGRTLRRPRRLLLRERLDRRSLTRAAIRLQPARCSTRSTAR